MECVPFVVNNFVVIFLCTACYDVICSLSLASPQAVESEMCPSFTAAVKAGKPVYTDAKPSLADGLAVPKVNFS